MSVEIYRTQKPRVTCGTIDYHDGVIACPSFHHNVEVHLNLFVDNTNKTANLVLVFNLMVKPWNQIASKQNLVLNGPNHQVWKMLQLIQHYCCSSTVKYQISPLWYVVVFSAYITI